MTSNEDLSSDFRIVYCVACGADKVRASPDVVVDGLFVTPSEELEYVLKLSCLCVFSSSSFASAMPSLH